MVIREQAHRLCSPLPGCGPYVSGFGRSCVGEPERRAGKASQNRRGLHWHWLPKTKLMFHRSGVSPRRLTSALLMYMAFCTRPCSVRLSHSLHLPCLPTHASHNRLPHELWSLWLSGGGLFSLGWCCMVWLCTEAVKTNAMKVCSVEHVACG